MIGEGNTGISNSVKVKLQMMKGFIQVSRIYFIFEIVMHGVLPMISLLAGDLASDTVIALLHQSIEFLVIMSLLVMLRPRDWPEYFSLDIFENQELQSENGLES